MFFQKRKLSTTEYAQIKIKHKKEKKLQVNGTKSQAGYWQFNKI